jgi:hypothetical protein
MSLNLPDRIDLPTDPPRRHLALATLTLYGIILAVHTPLRLLQENRYWSHRNRRNAGRVFARSLWNFINLVCISMSRHLPPEKTGIDWTVRIVANAMFLSIGHSTPKSMAVVIVVLQGVGVVPLVVQLSIVVIKWCAQVAVYPSISTTR